MSPRSDLEVLMQGCAQRKTEKSQKLPDPKFRTLTDSTDLITYNSHQPKGVLVLGHGVCSSEEERSDDGSYDVPLAKCYL